MKWEGLKSKSKAEPSSHPEDRWRGTQKHKGPSAMCSDLKAFILKTWLYDFYFNSNLHVQNSYQNEFPPCKQMLFSERASTVSALLSQWKANEPGGREQGGRVGNYTYSNNVFISQQLYNKKLSGAEFDLTTNSSRKPALLLSACVVFLCKHSFLCLLYF